MSEETKRILLGGIALLLVLWYFMRPKKGISALDDSNNADGFYAPYYWPNGIYPNYSNMTGQSNPNNSTINVYAENPALGMLDNKYIPIFGLVGMTGVSA